MRQSLLAAVVSLLCSFALALPAAAQCTGSVTLAAAAAPDQALVGETCCVRGSEIFFGAPNIGTVYVYRRQSSGNWMASAGTLARPANVTTADAFGRSVAADNEVAAVGAPLWSGGQGTVSLYKRTPAGAWSLLQQLVPPVGQANLFFGCSISMSNGFLLVGAPGALNGSGWMAGIAYIYERQTDGTFAYLTTLTPSTPATAVDGVFGQCVAISGSTLIVGAPGELYSGDTKVGSLYVFQRSTGGLWSLFERRKSPSTGVTVRAYGVDCCIDNGLVGVREQVVNAGVADRIWLYSVGASSLSQETSYTAGRSIQFSYDPPSDAGLVGSMSMHEGYMGIGSRTTETCDMFSRGATQWNLDYQLTNGGAGDIDMGASVSIGHDIMGIGMPYWVAGANLQPGAVWARSHVSRDCDGDSQTDACEAMSQANSAFDDDYDGIPDNCEAAAAPTAVTATAGILTTGVGVDWRIVTTASKYQLQRSDTGAPATIATTWAPDYLDTSALADVNYTYYVRSVDGAGNVSGGFIQTTGWRAFAAPTGLTATDGTSSTQVTVNWTAVSGAPQYKVLRAIGAGSAVEIGLPTTNTFADTTAVAGTTYTYSVKVKGLLGDSAASNTDTGYIASVNVPTNVQAGDGTTTTDVTITWNAVAGISGYKVYRGPPGGSLVFIKNVAAGLTTYADTTATALVAYDYAVAAVINSVVGPLSTPNGGWRNVAAPTGLTATDGTNSLAIVLGWNAVAGSTGYVIWRAPTGQALTQLATVSAGTLGYADPATAGISYTYAVQAQHALGTTAQSATDVGWRSLDAPTGVAATDGAYTNKIRITWNAVPDATGYRVQRTLPGGSETNLADVSAGDTLYDDTTVPALSVVQYRVRAISAAGNSAPSAYDTGWRNISAPTGMTASDGAFTDKVVLSWNAVPEATSYKVRRSVNGGSSNHLITVPAGTLTFNDATAPALATCTYTVAALHATGESSTSFPDAGWRNVAAPIAAASDGTESDGVKVQWPALAGVDGYKIYSGAAANSLTLAATVGKATTRWMDAQAPAATQRYYAVQAVHAQGSTAVGGVDGGWRGLPAPRAVFASNGTIKEYVDVTWKQVTNATGYMVLRTPTSGGNGSAQAFGPFTGLQWKDKSAVPGVRYTYAVAAKCALGICSYGKADSGWRPADATGTDNGSPPGNIQGSVVDGTDSGGDGGAGASVGGIPGGGAASGSDGSSDSGGQPPAGTVGGQETDSATGPIERVILAPWLLPDGLAMTANERMTMVLGPVGQPELGAVIVADGPLVLDGVLRVRWAPGIAVRPGAVWVLMLGTDITGSFVSVDLPAAPAGSHIELERDAARILLRVIRNPMSR